MFVLKPIYPRLFPAGRVMAWDGQALHWGSAPSIRAKHDRMSIAIEFQRADQPAKGYPLLPPQSMLTWTGRMRLLAKQAVNYAHIREKMSPLKEEFIASLKTYGKDGDTIFQL